MLYHLIVSPIEYIIEFVFVLLNRWLGNPGFAIIGVSLVVNILVLPIYKRADAIQEEERKKQQEMAPGLVMIRKAFHGDERFMMEQTFYREHHYSQLSQLKSFLPLLLQIPFFIAAYHFLSNLPVLAGTSFWFIRDLGAPDALITIGSVKINLLPVLMTCINFLSAVIYLRGFPLKDQIQTYVLALIFLVVLYQSPAGLVFYWTLNNVFSLGKNVVMKLLPGWNGKEHKDLRQQNEPRLRKDRRRGAGASDGNGTILPAQLFMTFLMGLVIPAAVINSSPGEFIILTSYQDPIHYVHQTLAVSAGYFLVWISIFYYLSVPKIRRLFRVGLSLLCVVAVVNYMFFGKSLGILAADLI